MVRLSVHAPRGRREAAHGAAALPARPEDRLAAPPRRQPDAAAGAVRARPPDRRVARELGPRDRGIGVGGLLPGPDRADGRLDRGVAAGVLRPVSALRGLVAVQLAALLLAAVATAARFPVWALVDEAAHFDYVQSIAEDGRLPVLDEDRVHADVLAIDEGTYPGPPRVPASRRGLFGRSYEGFQPPLAYALATPVYAIPSNHEAKLRALRGLGVVLLGVSALLTWLLARRVVPDAPLAAFSAALTFLLWPGVVVRAVTFSNAGLELVMGAALSLALWRALTERSDRWMVGAGAVTGAALLTKLTLMAFLPSLAIVGVAFLRAGRVRAVAAAAGLPALMVAPWVAYNLHTYGSTTGSGAVQSLMDP